MSDQPTRDRGPVKDAEEHAHTARTGAKFGNLVVNAGSRKSMLVQLALELWRRDQLELKQLVVAQGRGRIRSQKQAVKLLNRAPVADLEPLVLGSLDGQGIVVEGPVQESSARTLLRRLGADYDDPATTVDAEDEPSVRYIDMTPALLAVAAVVMALRYVALGFSDRELYVLAGLGYAGFMLVRTFAAELKRPKNAPPPEVDNPSEAQSPRSEVQGPGP